MKKLTAEKCCQLLDSLNSNGMSILEGYYCEALEIALSVLEQQDAKKQVSLREGIDTVRSAIAESGGYNFEALKEQQELGEGEGEWIEWKGGECPVDASSCVDVKFLNGDIIHGWMSGSWKWDHSGETGDIIAYRIIPERPTNQNGEQ